MTFKQLLLRYLKENGYYSILSRKSYSKLVKNNMSSNAIELLRLVDYILRTSGINWFYHGDRMYLFIKDWTNFNTSLKSGDTITVETPDGKYSFDFKVFDVWYSDFSVTLFSGGKISIDRIKAVNGKSVDFKNNWYFKRNLNYIH